MNRNYGLDLLRIIAMAMIVLRHGVYQSGVTSSPAATVLNRTIGVFVNDFTAVAVNCFVLITGYFLSKQEFRLKRLASIWLMVLFYSVGLFLCSAFLSSPAPLTFSGTSAWLYQVPPRIAAVFAAGCAVEWVRRRLFGRVFALPLLSRWKPQT